jgi:hypothetical protein
MYFGLASAQLRRSFGSAPAQLRLRCAVDTEDQPGLGKMRED